jgi:competence protein ComEA
VLLTSLAWLIVAGGATLAWRRPQPVAFQVQPPPATATPAPTPTPAPIKIELAGAVQQPGVYELPAGARVADAIAAGGGLAPNADGEALSLARPLQDGEKLVAPTVRPAQPAAATSSTPELATARSGGSDLSGAGLLNLNTASAQELEALPAIGPVTAQAIVDYRTANGPFRSVEEIVKVKGIGPATLEKLKPLITVGE